MSLPALLRLRARRHADLQPGDIAEGGKRRLEPASCVHTAAPSAAERPESSAGRGRLSGDRLLRWHAGCAFWPYQQPEPGGDSEKMV